jgi:DnaA family protein
VVKRGNIFVIEDIETKNNMEQVEAFNIFNDCKENSKKLFITGANSPNNMGLRSDLASRLSWGLVYQIKPLTDSEKKLALLSHSKQKGMSCNENVIEYCMRHLQRDLHYLIATLDALDNWSLKMKKPITIPLLKKLLENKD